MRRKFKSVIKRTEKVTICKRREPLFYDTNIQDSAVTQVHDFSVALSWAPFLETGYPLLKEGPLKITGEGPMGPH